MSRLPLVSPLDRALFLKAQPYFAGLPSSVLTVLASYSEEQFYPAGSSIRSENATIDRAIFLGSGEVRVGRPDASRGSGMRVQAPGAIGLAHSFAHAKRVPPVRAMSDTLCLEIGVDDLSQILEDHFSLLLQMTRTSAEQVRGNTVALGSARPKERGFSKEDRQETPVRLDLVQRLARAKRAPLFRETNLTVLGELFRSDQPDLIQPGEALWKPGDPIDRMAFVLDGGFRTDGTLGDCLAPAGATLGAWEIALESTRAEGWIATQPSRVLSISRELFIDLLEDHFEFAETYLRRVNRQILRGWDLLAERSAAEDAS